MTSGSTIFHFVLGWEQGVLENGNKVSDHRHTHPRKFPQQNKVGRTRLPLSQVLSRCVPILLQAQSRKINPEQNISKFRHVFIISENYTIE